MKLNWIASTTLSLLRAVELTGSQSNSSGLSVAPGRDSGGGRPVRSLIKDPAGQATFTHEVNRIKERLVSASVTQSSFWNHLIDEVVSLPSDPPLTPQLCEVALLRAGHSNLQSDQTAAAIFRSMNHCRRAFEKNSPRLAEQLRLRYAPLKQGYEAYGPGMLRSIGKQIWNGAPPKDWWPNKVAVHAVQPLRSGAAGRSSCQTCVWIEAVLTDVSPEVPEWLRLVQQLTEASIDNHTRTHLSQSGGSGSLPSSGSNSVRSDDSAQAATTTSELPWSLAIVPLILDQAGDRGLLSGTKMPLATALRLWRTSDEWNADDRIMNHDLLADVVGRWWSEIGSQAKAFPIALKQLSSMLAASGYQSQPESH